MPPKCVLTWPTVTTAYRAFSVVYGVPLNVTTDRPAKGWIRIGSEGMDLSTWRIAFDPEFVSGSLRNFIPRSWNRRIRSDGQSISIQSRASQSIPLNSNSWIRGRFDVVTTSGLHKTSASDEMAPPSPPSGASPPRGHDDVSRVYADSIFFFATENRYV